MVVLICQLGTESTSYPPNSFSYERNYSVPKINGIGEYLRYAQSNSSFSI